ncbi:MAG: hypothetical protein JNK33_05215, partial [Candidatus Doudnabacteria bacterium]|nr:hypothetical protein [Candidatus Doudnabacteria bacterium]
MNVCETGVNLAKNYLKAGDEPLESAAWVMSKGDVHQERLAERFGQGGAVDTLWGSTSTGAADAVGVMYDFVPKIVDGVVKFEADLNIVAADVFQRTYGPRVIPETNQANLAGLSFHQLGIQPANTGQPFACVKVAAPHRLLPRLPEGY